MRRRLADGGTPFDARDARSAGARSRTLREGVLIPPPPGATPPGMARVSPAQPDPAARLQTLASGNEEIHAPQVRMPDPPPDWNADGFVGEILYGFPYPRAGEDGQLGGSREPLRSTILRVAPEQRRILHQIQQLERRRNGVGVELERIIDCALVLLPEDLDALERFVAEAPRDLLRRQPPADIGTRLRASVHTRLDEIRERLGAEGRPPLRLTMVHRAALYHYSQSYLCRANVS